MKKVVSMFAIVALMATSAAAQSSGSFNYSTNLTACVDPSGALSGGIPPTVTALQTTLKTSSGNGNVFVIRPSAVVGLLTNVSVGSKNNTSSAQAGVDFRVTVTPLSGQAAPTVTPPMAVTYEDRFIQISTNLFQAIADACTTLDPVNGCFFNFNETTLGAHSFDWVASGLSSGAYGLTVTWTPHTSTTTGGTALTCVGPVVLTGTQAKIFTPSTGISF